MRSMPASLQARLAAALAGLAVWATVSPWLGEAVGLGLDVATRLEIADHVIPGLVALAAAALLATRGAKPGSVIWLGRRCDRLPDGPLDHLDHVPLIPDALDGVAPWAPALLHLSGGPPITVLGLWMLVRSQRSERTLGVQRGA
jgi:hypothetical protein